MFKMKDLNVFKRIVMPILSILGSVFMIIAAIYAHKWGTFYFLIVFSVIMLIGMKFENKTNVEENVNK